MFSQHNFSSVLLGHTFHLFFFYRSLTTLFSFIKGTISSSNFSLFKETVSSSSFHYLKGVLAQVTFHYLKGVLAQVTFPEKPEIKIK